MMIRPPYDDSLTMKVSIYTGKYIEIIISWGFKREKREKHSFFFHSWASFGSGSEPWKIH